MACTTHVELWKQCLAIIKDNIPETAYNTWFTPILPLKYEDKTLTLQVPSQFFYEFIEEKYVDLLCESIYKVIGEGTKLMYNVMVDKSSKATIDIEGSTRSTVIGRGNSTIRGGGNKAPNILQTPAVQDLDSHLHQEYTFDNFIEGKSNKLARAVALSVAEKPSGTGFNPLFLHGGSGVGKTHLISAIGTKIKEYFPDKRVLYISAYLFQVQYTDSVRNNTTNDFIKFYQTIDVLIIDDIQEMAGAVKTQSTFFHIFNHLHQNGKQLVLASDRAPVFLQGLEERLITRFKWGMVAELEKPDYELRRDILKKKIRRDGLLFPEEVINYIALNVTESIRDLEGVIVSLMAHSTVCNKDIDLSLTEQIMRKMVRKETASVTIDGIVNAVCKHFRLESEAIHTKSRKREVVQVRQVAMYLAKKHTDASSSKIGRLIGDKDHATVLHACKIVKEQCEVDKGFRTEVESIELSLKTAKN
ncbi:Chromosomal replication initiator protein DnaA [termite gut metagenome]|uniref:Chromosomal replication initiator protein DnaA n=1 Tax=termite gut metagenome TaxID=433724 RepID=A0A5J4SAK7_9ZZZZ